MGTQSLERREIFIATLVKRKLSGSTDGLGILIGTATGTAATTIHTAVSGTVAGSFDEIWIYAFNSGTANANLNLLFGGTTDPTNIIMQAIPFKSGLTLVVPGFVLQNGAVVRGYVTSGTTNVVYGFVNNITD